MSLAGDPLGEISRRTYGDGSSKVSHLEAHVRLTPAQLASLEPFWAWEGEVDKNGRERRRPLQPSVVLMLVSIGLERWDSLVCFLPISSKAGSGGLLMRCLEVH